MVFIFWYLITTSSHVYDSTFDFFFQYEKRFINSNWSLIILALLKLAKEKHVLVFFRASYTKLLSLFHPHFLLITQTFLSLTFLWDIFFPVVFFDYLFFFTSNMILKIWSAFYFFFTSTELFALCMWVTRMKSGVTQGWAFLPYIFEEIKKNNLHIFDKHRQNK